jgi:hypothetical protein
MIPQINIPPLGNMTFGAIQGTVCSLSKRSDSYVSGGGGERSVTTDIVYTTEFWLLRVDGTEKHYKLLRDIPLKENHQISLIYAEEGKTSYWQYLYNHSADSYYRLYDFYPTPKWIDFIVGIGCFWLLAVFFGGIVLSVIFERVTSYKVPSDSIIVVGIGIFLAFLPFGLVFYKEKARTKANRRIVEHIKTNLNWGD